MILERSHRFFNIFNINNTSSGVHLSKSSIIISNTLFLFDSLSFSFFLIVLIELSS